jgi:hypothetical protein
VLGGINDALGNTLIILNKGSEVVKALVSKSLLVLDEESDLGVALVVRDNLDELREVPRVPFADSHGESVDSLVELVQDGNSLDDVVVVTLDGKLHLGTGVGVTKTELGGVHITLAQLLQQLAGVETNTTKKILNDLAGVTGLAVDVGESGLNASCKTLIGKTQNHLLLLVRLGEVQVKERDQSLGGDTFGDVVDFAKGLLVVPVTLLMNHEKNMKKTFSRRSVLKRKETRKLNHLAKLSEVIDTLLNFLQGVADSVALVDGLEKRVAHRALEEEKVSHRY